MALRYVDAAGFRSLLEAGGGADPSEDQSIPASWDDAQLAVFLASAESELETRVRTRYAVPLPADPPAPIVEQLVVALASYHAMLAMRRGKDFESEQDPYLLRYQWAVRLLDAVAKGTADIPGASEGFDSEVFSAYEGRMFAPSDFGLPAGGAEHMRVTALERRMR